MEVSGLRHVSDAVMNITLVDRIIAFGCSRISSSRIDLRKECLIAWSTFNGEPSNENDLRCGTDYELVVVLPSLFGRVTTSRRRNQVQRVVDDLRSEIAAKREDKKYAVVSIVQCQNQLQVDQLIADISNSSGIVAAEGVDVIELVVFGSGKVLALNRVVSMLGGVVTYFGWVDDDVELHPECISMMLNELRTMPTPAAVGARKMPHSSADRISQVLKRAKAVVPSAMNYPHGCAMMVTFDVIEKGIPTKYDSDDGWVCFQLLDPYQGDPLWRMKLVPGARVTYTVGGRFRPTVLRLRRQRIGQILLAADADPAKASAYFKNCFLEGMHFVPKSSGPTRVRLEQVIYSWIHTVLSFAVLMELLARGIIGRPLTHINWGSEPHRSLRTSSE